MSVSPDPMPQPHAIFFDLDGTLLDSIPGIEFSVGHAFRHCALTRNNIDIRTLIGPPIREILAALADNPTLANLDCLEQAFRASYDTEGWQKTPFFPSAPDTLRTLQTRGIRLFVVSNKPRHIATRILQNEAILPLFEQVVTRDSQNPPYSRKTEMIRHLLASAQLNPHQSVMVGDTMEDAHAAQDTSVRFALMTHGYGQVPQDSPIPVALRLDHFQDLLPALTKEFAQ